MSAPARLPTLLSPHITLRRSLALLAGLLLLPLLALVAAPAARAQATAVPGSLLGEPVQQMAGGENHSCALTASGAVYCWGANANGQLGTGATGGTASLPAPIAGLTGVVAIAAGGSHSCALKTSGVLLCWGANASGQLGMGGSADAGTPQAVTALGNQVVAMALGGSHSCALTTVGEVHCWGSNVSGGLGNGSTVDADTPQLVTGLTGVAAIAAGGLHTCAVTTAGAVKCWGDNTVGQLGSGSAAASATTPESVTGLAGNAASISAAFGHTCVVSTAGALQCWGRNNYGQLGNGSTSASANTPQAVTGMASGVAAVAGGLFHTCALTTAGAALCWGDNTAGFLGNGGSTGANTPQPVTGLGAGVAALGAGYGHTCAATTAGTLQCWGDNFYGQLGNGSTTSANTPRPVAGLASAVAAVVTGYSHTCALTKAGGAQCWGSNNYGQLGDGSTTNKSVPQPVTGLASGVAAIAAGERHTCALTTAGAVLCWGYNAAGQLGDGSTTGATTPQPVTGLASGVAAIAVGRDHTCALTTAGAVQCWGGNLDGQLGDGSDFSATTPRPVTGLASGVAAIAAGERHTCALTTAGAMQCWGSNGTGQLGDGGSANYATTPQPVTGLTSGVAAIAAGYYHTCALTTAGAVQCWGYNVYGQLGNGSTNYANTPQPVTGLASGVASMAVGFGHTCALTTAGAVQCWGYNGRGQLGDGSNTQRNTPQSVAGLASGVAAIAAGRQHTCALTTAGAVQCWGWNVDGQLGNDSTADRNVPTRLAAAQAIDLPVPFSAPGAGASTTLSATASSGLAVGFDTFTPDVCTVSGTTLTVLAGKAGYLCGVQARQAGGAGSDGAYFAAAPTRSRLLHVATVPDAPTSVTASAGNAQATVSWTAPVSDGGSALTAYTAVAVADATKTCTVTTGSPLPITCTVTGLANGTAYTFTVKATNAVGDSLASAASASATPTAPPSSGGGGAPTTVNVNSTGTTTLTDPTLPIIVGPGAGGATIVVPGTGTTPVPLQFTVNGQPMAVTATPGTQLQVAQVTGQTVLVLVVLQGSASMTSAATGQPMALAGEVLLSSGAAGTRIDAQPLAVAVVSGSLVPPAGSLPALGDKGLMAGERLQVDATGKLVAITLGSIKGDGTQAGDAMVFANLPTSITVDGKVFARIAGTVPRLAGANLTQGLEVTASGVLLLRDGAQVLQLLPTQTITIDARLPDGVGFTPLGLLRWVRGGVVVQFAPAVADLAGLATAVTALLPDAKIKLGAEGVIQLTTGGATYVLKPDWTGAGTATGTPSIGVDAQGRIYLQIGTGARQLLLPALLSPTQAQAIFTAALPGAALAVKPGASDGSLTLTLGGAQWRLMPQWVLPTGNDATQTTPWRLGADGVLYLKLGTQVQGLKIAD